MIQLSGFIDDVSKVAMRSGLDRGQDSWPDTTSASPSSPLSKRDLPEPTCQHVSGYPSIRDIPNLPHISDNLPRGNRSVMSASVKAFFGVVAVDLASALPSEESSLGQANVALLSTISPVWSNDPARGISADDMYFSIRRQETNPGYQFGS